ncbi:hypothetical protein BaRGS_00006211 [Batillaria attramentaria]|uniref:Uncharacterized protein n=1 Tax=Batillaria attramentaria TaxID=370345 RepID=A0ABD0LU88_9CAEN
MQNLNTENATKGGRKWCFPVAQVQFTSNASPRTPAITDLITVYPTEPISKPRLQGRADLLLACCVTILQPSDSGTDWLGWSRCTFSVKHVVQLSFPSFS